MYIKRYEQRNIPLAVLTANFVHELSRRGQLEEEQKSIGPRNVVMIFVCQFVLCCDDIICHFP